MNCLRSLLLAFALVGIVSPGTAQEADSWESFAVPASPRECEPVLDRSLLQVTEPSRRDEAIAMLEHAAVVALDDAESERLTGLPRPQGAGENLQPYMVRAVAKHVGTGRFLAGFCGDDIYVVHGSLGRSTPPSLRVPIVLYLDRRPERVFASWNIAE